MVARAKLKGALILAGVFLLGAATGGLTCHALAEKRYAQELMLGPGLRHEQRMLSAFADELDLSETQREAVRSILGEHRRARQRIIQEFDQVCIAPMRAEKAKIDDAIRALLSPEQRRRFEALLARQARARGPQGAGPGVPPGGFGPGHGRHSGKSFGPGNRGP